MDFPSHRGQARFISLLTVFVTELFIVKASRVRCTILRGALRVASLCTPLQLTAGLSARRKVMGASPDESLSDYLRSAVILAANHYENAAIANANCQPLCVINRDA